jgi:hypothetical protein
MISKNILVSVTWSVLTTVHDVYYKYKYKVGWTIGVLGFDSRRGLGIFLFSTASRSALGLTQPPIQWVPRALPLGVKRPGRKYDHSPPYSAEVKECMELYLHSPNTPLWSGVQLKKHKNNFTLPYLTLPYLKGRSLMQEFINICVIRTLLHQCSLFWNKPCEELVV